MRRLNNELQRTLNLMVEHSQRRVMLATIPLQPPRPQMRANIAQEFALRPFSRKAR
jgi:hypothetical protein